MKTVQGVVFHRFLAAGGAFLFLCFSSTAFSADHGEAKGTVITCPLEITDLSLNYATKYTPPKGWGHADAQSRKTKGGALTNLTLVRNGNELRGRNLVCLYGAGAGDGYLRLAAIKKTLPKGASCTVEPEYKFKCINMGE